MSVLCACDSVDAAVDDDDKQQWLTYRFNCIRDDQHLAERICNLHTHIHIQAHSIDIGLWKLSTSITRAFECGSNWEMKTEMPNIIVLHSCL